MVKITTLKNRKMHIPAMVKTERRIFKIVWGRRGLSASPPPKLQGYQIFWIVYGQVVLLD